MLDRINRKLGKLSALAIVSNLFHSAPKTIPKLEPEEDGGKIPLTLRFDPEVHRYYTNMAEHLSINTQTLVSMLLKGIALESTEDTSNQLNAVCHRFRTAFSEHNISELDIPKLIPEISRSQLLSDDKLIDAIDDDVIKRVSEIFHYRTEYLRGVDSKHVSESNVRYWYKESFNIIRHIAQLKAQGIQVKPFVIIPTMLTSLTSNRNSQIANQLKQACLSDDNSNHQPISFGLLYTEMLNGLPIRRVKLYISDRWNYSKCRSSLGFTVHCLQMSGIHVKGAILPKDVYYEAQWDQIHPVMLFELLESVNNHWDIESVFNQEGVFTQGKYEGQLDSIKQTFTSLMNREGKTQESDNDYNGYFCDRLIEGMQEHISFLQKQRVSEEECAEYLSTYHP
ncbi:hypothetical protein HRJ45_19800 [Vibrio coralliilyticus]|uniref:hypothetical protein n=1 Tax=Vibrio coralliilyticus TaxID=190893 RepID=UPI00155F6642|nr:hypothetical protein [Vibrio coralliilyticus]NRF27103.1 hypothetical protein [Vibrio coralliilyticus]NRF81357.1 hypothetical protein [Vibrio coralliilyticus]